MGRAGGDETREQNKCVSKRFWNAAKVVVDACHCLDIGCAGNVNGNVLMFVRPAHVPLARGLEYLYADYVTWAHDMGYSSRCLKFTPDRMHVQGSHIHINGFRVLP